MTINTHTLTVRRFEPPDQPQVIALWHRCGLVTPWNDPAADIARKSSEQPELFLVGETNGDAVATCMAGYEGHRGWINYLAVDPLHRRHGYGRRMMRHAEALLRVRGCPKINLQVRMCNVSVIAFYARLGYRRDEVVSLGKRME